MSIGVRIRQIRELRNVSLEDAAAHVGISAAEMEQVESGERQLTHQEILELCKVLDIPVDDLFKKSAEGGNEESGGESVLIPTDKLNALLDEMADD